MDSSVKSTDDDWFGEFELANELVLNYFSFNTTEDISLGNNELNSTSSMNNIYVDSLSTVTKVSEPMAMHTTSTCQTYNADMKREDINRLEFRVNNTREKQKDMIARITKTEQIFHIYLQLFSIATI